MARRRNTRRAKRGGSYPFVGPPYTSATWGTSNYYANNENPLIFLHSRPVGGRKRRTRKRFVGGDDRFNSFSAVQRWTDQATNLVRSFRGEETLPVGRVLDQPIR